jgi:ribose/xylose/arabinose/galactoside ABC-type transport system permease subunit
MILGVLVLGVLTNGLNVSGVSGSYQIVVVGGLLVFTVVLDRLTSYSS